MLKLDTILQKKKKKKEEEEEEEEDEEEEEETYAPEKALKPITVSSLF